MSMLAGSVSVDDDGNESYNPDNSLNAAKALYLLLKADQSSLTMTTRIPTAPTVSIDRTTGAATITPGTHVDTTQIIELSADAKKAQARLANTIASWMVTYLQANALVTTTIGTTTDFDGLQLGTTAPGVAKTLNGTIS